MGVAESGSCGMGESRCEESQCRGVSVGERLVFVTRVWYFSLAFGIFYSRLVLFTGVWYFPLAFGFFHSRLVFLSCV